MKLLPGEIEKLRNAGLGDCTGGWHDAGERAEWIAKALAMGAGAAQQFAPGFTLELDGAPEQCHGHCRFDWMIRMPDSGTSRQARTARLSYNSALRG
ncbi:MAG: hypothetical protein FJW39_28370 [Acidobacteria bacterium]|nr:hypothetical protein [Acidobacteriota bacterium]